MGRRDAGIHLPPPVALARLAESLEVVDVPDPAFDAKWDGWRGGPPVVGSGAVEAAT